MVVRILATFTIASVLLGLTVPAIGAPTVIEGTCYDPEGNPLAGVSVTYSAFSDTTDASGSYFLGATSSLPDGGSPPQVEFQSWGQVKKRFQSVEPSANRGIDLLMFAKDGYWDAWADVSEQQGTVSFHATMVSVVSSYDGGEVSPWELFPIWNIVPGQLGEHLTGYLIEDLPIGVDIENLDQPNNQYTNADSAWVNDAIDRFNVLVRPVYGVDQYVWMPGNGAPNRQTGKTGILWQVDDNGSNSTDRYLYLDNAHMLGAKISIQPQELANPGGDTREKELFYRANNGTSSQWPIGIFKTSPQARVPFNDRHLVLHAQLNKASQTGKNDLSAWDYIRPLELPPPER